PRPRRGERGAALGEGRRRREGTADAQRHGPRGAGRRRVGAPRARRVSVARLRLAPPVAGGDLVFRPGVGGLAADASSPRETMFPPRCPLLSLRVGEPPGSLTPPSPSHPPW